MNRTLSTARRRLGLVAGSLVCLAAVLVLATLGGGCGTAGIVLKEQPREALDVVVVPGCPVEEDGSLSRCLQSRVLWAAVLWERGYAKSFIVSGAAVHSRFVEAEAIAAGLASLGVPGDHIWLEPDALHTDENMYLSARIARELGMRTMAVASNGGHALWACKMLMDWGQDCRALPVDLEAVRERHAKAPGALESLRLPRVPDAEWVPLEDRELQRARAAGRKKRPPSLFLYAMIAMMKWSGEHWIPFAPATITKKTWATRLAELEASGVQISRQ